jgi:hypothetical protein
VEAVRESGGPDVFGCNRRGSIGTAIPFLVIITQFFCTILVRDVNCV